MKIEAIGVKKEVCVYAVDGREIEVPYETLSDRAQKSDDFNMRFWVSDAVDNKTREKVSAEIRRELAKHIADGSKKEGLTFEVIAER